MRREIGDSAAGKCAVALEELGWLATRKAIRTKRQAFRRRRDRALAFEVLAEASVGRLTERFTIAEWPCSRT